jgi:hypothetical protein
MTTIPGCIVRVGLKHHLRRSVYGDFRFWPVSDLTTPKQNVRH